MEQSSKSHGRYVPGFHIFTFGLMLVSLAVAVTMMVRDGISLITIFAVLAGLTLGMLFFYLRRFGTQNQDRTIRAEEQFRYHRLSGSTHHGGLGREQVIALRFASDDELVALTDKAVKENMSPAAIKESIRNWRADHHRI